MAERFTTRRSRSLDQPPQGRIDHRRCRRGGDKRRDQPIPGARAGHANNTRERLLTDVSPDQLADAVLAFLGARG